MCCAIGQEYVFPDMGVNFKSCPDLKPLFVAIISIWKGTNARSNRYLSHFAAERTEFEDFKQMADSLLM